MPSDPPAPRRSGLLRNVASSVRRWFAPRASGPSGPPAPVAPAYPGDFTGRLTPQWAPRPDGRPDPGEIVWTWVPFEEDHSQGKDRPVLLVGRDGPWLLALQLTSKDHEGRASAGGHRRWVDVGAGDWDRQRRPSEVRVDRVVRVDPAAVRREGAVLPRARFEAVARAVSELHR